MSVPAIVATSIPMDGGHDGVRTLVLGPSLGTTTAIWDRVRPLLAPSHPLLAWDLPGHGASPAAAAPFSMEELAQGVLDAIDAAGVERFAFAGISLGGVVGLQLALDDPKRVTSLAMVCALPKIATADTWLKRAADVRAMGTPSLVTATAGRWFTPAFLDRERDVSSRVLHGLLDIDDESYALCVDALRETDLRERVSELKIPLSLIVGDSDPVIPLEDARTTVAAARQGTLHVIAAASHLAAVEHPAQVAGILVTETSNP
ncbi:MAG TPA: alpha/beta fold hydrolase [Pseudolysinimonas sp.]|nr:alpha/beta fold hydrolase [Pseudolysinimonas sp.]